MLNEWMSTERCASLISQDCPYIWGDFTNLQMWYQQEMVNYLQEWYQGCHILFYMYAPPIMSMPGGASKLAPRAVLFLHELCNTIIMMMSAPEAPIIQRAHIHQITIGAYPASWPTQQPINKHNELYNRITMNEPDWSPIQEHRSNHKLDILVCHPIQRAAPPLRQASWPAGGEQWVIIIVVIISMSQRWVISWQQTPLWMLWV